MPTRARRAAETSSRPARSLARPPQWDSHPKLLSTTQRRASTTKPSARGSRATTRWRIPWRFDHSRQRSAANAASKPPPRRGGRRALPASSASGASRSWTEAGTTATASQCPSASTRATRLRPTTPLAASYPRGPRTPMHFTAWVSMMASVGPGRRPALRRRRRATSRSRASNRPRSSQRRNQPYTVRQAGKPVGRARQGPPTRKCQAIAPTTRRTGVARPLRGGSARSNQAAISSTAHAATSSFRPGSCRARCTSVHIPSSAPIPDDHAPPSETPRSGGNRRPIRTQTGCQTTLTFLQDRIGRKPDGVADVLGFQQLVQLGLGEAGVAAEVQGASAPAVAGDHRLEDLPPAFRAVHVAGPQGAALEVAELVQDEQRVVAGAAEVAVPGRALLRAVGRALRAVHVEDDAVRRSAFVHPIDSGAGQSGERRQVRLGREPPGLEAAHLAARRGRPIDALPAP